MWTSLACDIFFLLLIQLFSFMSVHMVPPGDMAVAANARNVTVLWRWKVQRYYDLDVTCQINVSDGETSVMVSKERGGNVFRSCLLLTIHINS